MTANWVDLLVAVLVGVPLATGLKDGLISGLLRGAGLVLAAILAVWKMPLLVSWIGRGLGLSGPSAVLGVLALALGTGWLLGMLAAWGWKKVSAGSVGWADRLAGGAFGALKGALVALGVIAGLSLLFPRARWAAQQSWLGHHALGPAMEWTRSWVEDRIHHWRTEP
ncbi:MAG TPA: CvpA family protein [Fibrobacteria bacterium]|nr:CvpA family protein [Fibrobacteria bacterium]